MSRRNKHQPQPFSGPSNIDTHYSDAVMLQTAADQIIEETPNKTTYETIPDVVIPSVTAPEVVEVVPPAEAVEATCLTCPAWVRIGLGSAGECRFMAPSCAQISGGGLQSPGAWLHPTVAADHWCGQHPLRVNRSMTAPVVLQS